MELTHLTDKQLQDLFELHTKNLETFQKSEIYIKNINSLQHYVENFENKLVMIKREQILRQVNNMMSDNDDLISVIIEETEIFSKDKTDLINNLLNKSIVLNKKTSLVIKEIEIYKNELTFIANIIHRTGKRKRITPIKHCVVLKTYNINEAIITIISEVRNMLLNLNEKYISHMNIEILKKDIVIKGYSGKWSFHDVDVLNNKPIFIYKRLLMGSMIYVKINENIDVLEEWSD